MSAEAITYRDSKALARHSDPHVRADLSLRKDIRPEVLFFLAEDPCAEVRRGIARNPNTPHQADLILARDNDPSVREALAAKVVRLTPGLRRADQERTRSYVVEALELLARDEAVRIRRILADALKEVAGAPHSVIWRLARDADEQVAVPVLELSPVLSDADLLEIIAEGCASGRLRAISRRHGLGVEITDAIVARDDVNAVAALLENDSAQIREETLDSLVERAAPVRAWHAPLVQRPQLSSRAACKLAGFVAEHLLDQLRARADLDEETMRRVGDLMQRRLQASGRDEETADIEGRENESEEVLLMNALMMGDRGEVCRILSGRAELSQYVVRRIANSNNAKGVTALAWKAGLSMQTAVQIQVRLAGISPRAALQPTVGGKYPMKEEEMAWQLEFFGSMTH